jgi:hypothetical protein
LQQLAAVGELPDDLDAGRRQKSLEGAAHGG